MAVCRGKRARYHAIPRGILPFHTQYHLNTACDCHGNFKLAEKCRPCTCGNCQLVRASAINCTCSQGLDVVIPESITLLYTTLDMCMSATWYQDWDFRLRIILFILCPPQDILPGVQNSSLDVLSCDNVRLFLTLNPQASPIRRTLSQSCCYSREIYYIPSCQWSGHMYIHTTYTRVKIFTVNYATTVKNPHTVDKLLATYQTYLDPTEYYVTTSVCRLCCFRFKDGHMMTCRLERTTR